MSEAAQNAAEVSYLELKVGRVLHGWLLAVAVLLRDIPFRLLDGYGLLLVAPAWILVKDRGTAQTLFTVSAGRDPGAGEYILAEMTRDAQVMTLKELTSRWHAKSRRVST